MIFIRRAETTDAAQIQRVYTSANAYSNTLQLPHPTVEMWLERLKQIKQSDTLLVAMYDGVIVGTGGLHMESSPRRRHIASLGLSVADSFSGRGVGTALLAELLNLSDNWLNVLRVELSVFCDNAAAVHLYNKFGFEIEGTQRAHSLRNGVFVDAYSMARFHPKQPQVPRTGF